MNSMHRLNLLLLMGVILAACSQPRPTPLPTVTSRPTIIPLPSRLPTLTAPPSPGPSITPKPTRTIGPVATPAASIVFTSTDSLFTLEVPSNWVISNGKSQMSNSQSQQMNYVILNAPGTKPQPAILIYYGWPAANTTTSDDIWERAYALASVSFKVCPMTLTTGGSITLGGEPGKYIGYLDSCGVQGELIGLIHNTANFGFLIEAPNSLWDKWRPVLRDIIGSLAFTR